MTTSPSKEEQSKLLNDILDSMFQGAVEFMKYIDEENQPNMAALEMVTVSANAAANLALVKLLAAKGVFTEEEHNESLIQAMMVEKGIWEEKLTELSGTQVILK